MDEEYFRFYQRRHRLLHSDRVRDSQQRAHDRYVSDPILREKRRRQARLRWLRIREAKGIGKQLRQCARDGCNAEFISTRSTQKFCCAHCRHKAYAHGTGPVAERFQRYQQERNERRRKEYVARRGERSDYMTWLRMDPELWSAYRERCRQAARERNAREHARGLCDLIGGGHDESE